MFIFPGTRSQNGFFRKCPRQQAAFKGGARGAESLENAGVSGGAQPPPGCFIYIKSIFPVFPGSQVINMDVFFVF